MFSDFEVGYEPRGIDERTEGQLRGALTQAAHAMGPEKFHGLVLKTLLTLEPVLRQKCKPTDPAIKMLDEHYAAKLREERGFE